MRNKMMYKTTNWYLKLRLAYDKHLLKWKKRYEFQVSMKNKYKKKYLEVVDKL